MYSHISMPAPSRVAGVVGNSRVEYEEAKARAHCGLVKLGIRRQVKRQLTKAMRQAAKLAIREALS